MNKMFFFFFSCCLFSCSSRTGSGAPDPSFTQVPCNMQTISLANANWKATDRFEQNQVFIAPPSGDKTQWQDWYQDLLEYRDHMRNNMNDPHAYFIDLNLLDPAEHYTYAHAAIQLNRLLSRQLRFLPGEKMEIDLKLRHRSGSHTLYLGYEFGLFRLDRAADQEARPFVDSLVVPPGEDWQELTLETTIPAFDTNSLSILPILSIDTKRCDSNTRFYIRDISFRVKSNDRRTAFIDKTKPANPDPRMDRQIYDRPENRDNKQNFVMGFVFIWDKDFYDPRRNEYEVDHYCDLMQREFGGFNSVVLWHGYPMLGVDERNQFDVLRRMPGGLPGLHEAIGRFHRRNIKVFVAYTPWDEMTRREDKSDQDAFAGILDSTGIDGIYFDTRAEGGTAFRDAVDKVGKGINFATELAPSFFDIQGRQACIDSWAQYGSYQPLFADRYPGFGVLQSKWIIPDHMQFQIDRWRQDHTEELQVAWINGSGIMVWENIFGSWNPWNMKNKKELRAMNGIWRHFSDLYTGDGWKPYYPTRDSVLLSSVWENDSLRLINIVNPSGPARRYGLPPELAGRDDLVFDLWNGRPMHAADTVTVEKMGCILVRKDDKGSNASFYDLSLILLLDRQAAIARQAVTGKDAYAAAASVKDFLHYRYPARPAPCKIAGLLSVKAGDYTLHISHFDRESGCYPDPSTPDSLVWDKFLRGDHQAIKRHTLSFHTGDYEIMPRVVTNSQFETFLRATHYRPASNNFFLAHWSGGKCPDPIRDSPVVYVDINDARAYAIWAGMQLPTEAEWQEAAEQDSANAVHSAMADNASSRDSARFHYNEVFELTEGIRDDGHNRFLMLRGGSSWNPWSSEWYFPGGFYPGGAQPGNSHVKQLLIYPGIDRASTIGFRCVKRSTPPPPQKRVHH
jgi:iron(II)-dependent oxidoreductase